MIIGVTGGIACGKSEVCRILKRNGFTIIDADDVAHSVLEIPEVIDEITAIFGPEILDETEDTKGTKKINRKRLGNIVFADPEKLNMLENVTHPQIVDVINDMIKRDINKNYVIEAIELVSSGLIDICDELWVVHAEPEQQMERLMNSRHLTRQEAEARLTAQTDHDWDEAKADHIIYSIEPIEAMEKQVIEAL